MDALKLSQSRLENLEPHEHIIQQDKQAALLSSQKLGSDENAYGSGQFSLVSPPRKPITNMQHFSNASLNQNRLQEKVPIRQRPITSNQRGFSVGSNSRGRMLQHGKRGPGRITEKHIGLARNSAGTASGDGDLAGKLTKVGTNALLQNQSVITTTAGAGSYTNFKNFSVSKRQRGGRTQQQVRKESRATILNNSSAAQRTSQGNIIDLLSLQPTVQVEYRGGRVMAKQQSHPDISMANAVTQLRPQSITSTQKKIINRRIHNAQKGQRPGSRTQRPIHSAHKGRIARNSAAILTQKTAVKQSEELEALEQQQELAGMRQQQMSASLLQGHQRAGYIKHGSVPSESAESSAPLKLASAGLSRVCHSKPQSTAIGSALNGTFEAGFTANAMTTAYASNSMSVNNEGRQCHSFGRNEQGHGESSSNLEPIKRSLKEMIDVDTSTNQMQFQHVSNLVSPAVTNHSYNHQLLGNSARDSGNVNPLADINVNDQQPTQRSYLVSQSMRVPEVNDVIKEERYTDSHQVSVSAEEALTHDFQVASGVYDVEQNLQEIKHNRGISSLQHSNANAFDSFSGIHQRPNQQVSHQPSHYVSCSITEDPQRSYVDQEDFNTSVPQRQKLRTLLNQNVEKLMRKKKRMHRVDFAAPAIYAEHEFEQVQEGAMRLLDNLDAAMRQAQYQAKSDASSPGSVKESMRRLNNSGTPGLYFERFELKDKLREIDERRFINPNYYDQGGEFDLRKRSNGSCGGPLQQQHKQVRLNSHYLQSAFWNPKTHMVLTAKSLEKQPYINTNTRSFAQKFTRKAPRYRVRQAYKADGDKPQPGYYDTKQAFDKTFGHEVVNSVNMDLEPARKDIFTAKNTVSSTDGQPLQNKWGGHEIPQAYMDFEGMMSRKDQTVAITHAGLKWMFEKSADEITRAKLKKARDDHVREVEDRTKTGSVQEQIDWSSENTLSPFTFDIMKMGKVTRMFNIGREMTDDKVNSIVDDQKAENQRKKEADALLRNSGS